jgi:putative ABC transport system substrate-binding protein
VIERSGAVLVLRDDLFDLQLVQIVALAAQRRLPTMTGWGSTRTSAVSSPMGSISPICFAAPAGTSTKILKGTAPRDLALAQPEQLEFVVNLKAARELGLAIPTSVLVEADEVIE